MLSPFELGKSLKDEQKFFGGRTAKALCVSVSDLVAGAKDITSEVVTASLFSKSTSAAIASHSIASS
jgi:hypothetical protein